MFTGIITHIGALKKSTNNVVEISAPFSILKQLKIGDSIAVSGVCLTVTKKTKDAFLADVMPETWQKTNLGKLKINALLNLELPLRAGELLSGHIVQGHVDGAIKIVSIKKSGNSRILTFTAPENIAQRLADKGSVTVSGIALTVIKVQRQKFSVGIIPHTWTNTSLREAKVGDLVNVEVDHSPRHSEQSEESKIRSFGKPQDDIRIAIISSSFHKEITEALKMNCVKTLIKGGVPEKQIRIIDVPGALEIPLVAQKLAKQKKYDAIIALGVIHKGATYHFEQVSNECIRGCMEVSEDYEIPVIYEVLSVYEIKDAKKRIDRGIYAAETALTMIWILSQMQ